MLRKSNSPTVPMKWKFILGIIAGLLIIFGGLAAAPNVQAANPIYDAYQDFSINSNTNSVYASTATAETRAIQVFRSLSDFSATIKVEQVITFDKLANGTSIGNPALLKYIDVRHSSAETFKAWGNILLWDPVSPPNVLGPFNADGTAAFGDTTLTFPKTTKAVGFFLIIPGGSNQDATWTSTITAIDVKKHIVTVAVTFRGQIGEQKFVGFKSLLPLVSISFTTAIKPDAYSSVALDSIMIGDFRPSHREGKN